MGEEKPGTGHTGADQTAGAHRADRADTAGRDGGAHAAGYRRLARDADRRVLAGVCTGLGRSTGIDPVVFRVAFAILVLAHGQGILVYVAAVLLMPSRPDESSRAERVFKRWFDAGAVLTILGALLTAGVALSLFGGVTTDAIALVVVFGLVLMVAHARGVELVSVARSVPERLVGHPPEPSADWTRAQSAAGGAPASADRPAYPAGGGLPEGMIDLAAYGAAHSERTAPGPAAGPVPAYGAAVAAPRERAGRSPATLITLLAAMAAGAALVPVANGYPAPDSWLIVMAPALAVVGLGLVVGGWFRTPGLATAGTVLSLALLTGSVAGDVPRDAKYGDVEWRPVDAAKIDREYKLGVGSGRLDLTALPVAPGRRITVRAEVALGSLEVRLPPAARVELDARLRLGDLRVDQRTTSGPNAKVVRTLEPEGAPSGDPPVIELRIRGKVGDVDVRHA